MAKPPSKTSVRVYMEQDENGIVTIHFWTENQFKWKHLSFRSDLNLNEETSLMYRLLQWAVAWYGDMRMKEARIKFENVMNKEMMNGIIKRLIFETSLMDDRQKLIEGLERLQNLLL